MCEKAVEVGPWLLIYVPDWFITQQQLKLWHDDKQIWHDDDNNEFIKWYEDYEKRKAQKAKIKEELLPIAWHPDRAMD